MDTDESVLPFSDLDNIGWKWGLFYIILSIVLIFVIPSLLVLKDIKSKGISTKEITFNNIRESLKTTLIRGNIIEQIRHFNSPFPVPGAGAGAGSQDPTIINPDEIPPKTCADINGNPDNPIPFTCVSEGEELIYSPENKTCLPNSGCTELDCCVNSGSSSCKLGLFSSWDYVMETHGSNIQTIQYGYVSRRPIRGTYDNTISNNIMDYLDLSEISPDISRPQYNYPDHNIYTVYDTQWTQHPVDMETPFILNCNAGYVNPNEYTTELRDLYFGTGIITDYERQAVITCGEEGYLKYGQNNDFLPCSVEQ